MVFLLPQEIFSFLRSFGGSIAPSNLENAVTFYEDLHSVNGGTEVQRKENYTNMINIYYDVATSFYEYGWCQSFHFSSRLYNETFHESIKRHEHYVALRLGLKPGMKVLDLGCGIGGPLREIAAFSGATVIGVNNNESQIKRGTVLNKQYGVAENCQFLKADFMKIPVPDNSIDAAYNMESCCHAPDLVALYKELYRVLKPGQCVAGYDWCMTKEYDPNDQYHNKVKDEIEFGNSLPTIRSTTEYIQAIKAAGFRVLMEEDMADKPDVHIPWYDSLNPNRLSLDGFRRTWLARLVGRQMLKVLEFTRIAPKGSIEVNELLERSGNGLYEGGRLRIFTPIFFYLAQKPHNENI
ncbi:hypothetical protein KP509_05G023700 [Ceratopteris richardii]|uniref:Methyltransferase n=1 Tax=Ceratopteris richardii TaxID=49495 RepID=A0A8T2URK3_CERRI|nr:hypothetical protein KP509_05G023700 [Ceratopteris richardii]